MKKKGNLNNQLEIGIPSVDDVVEVQHSDHYALLKSYSSRFLLNNSDCFNEYRWIKDSFNQWSRIYEYPYCFQQISKNIISKARVLDAGSGVTFFPFFLSDYYSMTCIDQDDYSVIYNSINYTQGTNVEFIKSTLSDIKLPDNSFDAIYCISVLEHTNNYDNILEEINRLLKPDGIVVITFDISLDGNKYGIEKDTAIHLIDNINCNFSTDYNSKDFLNDLDENDIYSLQYVAKNMPYNLLPWPKSTLLQKIKNVIFRRRSLDSINLTFCNLHAKHIK